MNFKEYILGALPSAPDENDYNIAKLLAPVNIFPEEFLAKYTQEWWPKNQGAIGSCVPHSLSYVTELINRIEKNAYTELSVGFLYANRLPEHHQGEGMYPREALQMLLHSGEVAKTDFPENDTYPVVKAKLEERRLSLIPTKSNIYRISAYARLYNTSEIKNALMQIGPVTVSYPIYSNFYSTPWSGLVPLPSGVLQGYHMLTIVGWKKIDCVEHWVVLNSWGDMWGDYGRCYIQPQVEFTEAWSVTDHIEPLPEPKPTYWRVQVGAFSMRDNAEKYKVLLGTLGYNVYIVLVNGLYKCQLGAFSNKAYAEALRDKLVASDIKAFIVNY